MNPEGESNPVQWPQSVPSRGSEEITLALNGTPIAELTEFEGIEYSTGDATPEWQPTWPVSISPFHMVGKFLVNGTVGDVAWTRWDSDGRQTLRNALVARTFDTYVLVWPDGTTLSFEGVLTALLMGKSTFQARLRVIDPVVWGKYGEDSGLNANRRRK